MDALSHRLRAGGFDRWQSIGQHRGKDGDHLPITIVRTGEPPPHPLERGRQEPVSERRAVAQCARLAGKDRHVVPRVVDRLAAAVAAAMLGDDASVLADHDPGGIGVDLDRAPDRTGVHRVFVVVEADQAGLRDRCRQCMEPIAKRPR